jgi:hypothetical protein
MRRAWLVALLAGGATVFAFAPFGLFPLAFLGLGVLAWLLGRARRARAPDSRSASPGASAPSPPGCPGSTSRSSATAACRRRSPRWRSRCSAPTSRSIRRSPGRPSQRAARARRRTARRCARRRSSLRSGWVPNGCAACSSPASPGSPIGYAQTPPSPLAGLLAGSRRVWRRRLSRLRRRAVRLRAAAAGGARACSGGARRWRWSRLFAGALLGTRGPSRPVRR